MSEDLKQAVETEGIDKESVSEHQDGATAAKTPRPGAGDIFSQATSGFPPLPTVLVEPAPSAPTADSMERAEFLGNILRTDSGMADANLDEATLHAERSFIENGDFDELDILETLRFLNTAQGGRARKEFGAVLRDAWAVTMGQMSKLGNKADGMDRAANGQGR